MGKQISNLVKKCSILKDAIIGNLMKTRVWFDINIRKGISLSDRQDSSLIVSLTSYGYRAHHCVVYTIYSLLKQRVRPAKVVLWLDDKEFENKLLPKDLVFLQKYGLDIRFTEDLRSYTKLIPALQFFNDKNIITVDDDIYYTSDLTEILLETHEKNPKSIITNYAITPKLMNDNTFAPYIEWPELHYVNKSQEYDKRMLFPQGYGGVFYPAGVFDDEVMNKDVFMKLCPLADDVWFFVMGLRCNVEKVIPIESKTAYYLTDLFRQISKKDRLYDANVGEDKNDIQLRALIQHYNLQFGD